MLVVLNLLLMAVVVVAVMLVMGVFVVIVTALHALGELLPRTWAWSIMCTTEPMLSPAASRMSSTQVSLSPPLQMNTSAWEMRITSRGVGSKLWASRPAVTSRYGSTRSPPMARTKS